MSVNEYNRQSNKFMLEEKQESIALY